METKNREKLLLIVIGALVALYLLNLLIFSPLIDSWHSRSDEIAKLKKQNEEGSRLVQRESTIRDRWENMQANALPNNPTAAERQLFTAFDRWVNAGGVAEGSFSPQIQEGESNYTTVQCRSDVSGGPVNIGNFLKAMSRDPLADKVDSFTLTTKDDNGQQLALVLGLNGLILTDSDPSTNPPGPVTPPTPQNASQDPDSPMNPFHFITINNIFNQNRVWRGEQPIRRTERNVRSETLTSLGTIIDHGQAVEFFAGSDVNSSKPYNEGASVGDFKITKITLKTVTLTNASSSTNFVLPTDGSASLRRDDNGPWHPTGLIAANPEAAINATTTDTPTASVGSTPAAGGSSSSIEEMLRKRREEAEAK